MRHFDEFMDTSTTLSSLDYDDFSSWLRKAWSTLEILEDECSSGEIPCEHVQTAVDLYQTFQAFYLCFRRISEETITIERSFALWQPTLLRYLEGVDSELGALEYFAGDDHWKEVEKRAAELEPSTPYRHLFPRHEETAGEGAGTTELQKYFLSWQTEAKKIDNNRMSAPKETASQ